MTNAVITWMEAELAKLKASSEVQTVESDVESIGSSALTYIKTNGLTDLYQIAIAALAGAATGTPWATISATVVSQGEAAGISIAKGAETIVLAQAQADLIAAGKLVAPSTGAIVTASPTA
jgi:hypothetical protein